MEISKLNSAENYLLCGKCMFVCSHIKDVLLLLGDMFNSCHGHLSSSNQQDSEDVIKWSASWSLLICLMCALNPSGH